MIARLGLALLCLLSLALTAQAQAKPRPRGLGYHDARSLEKRLDEFVAMNPKMFKKLKIGQSRGGRPIHALLLTDRSVGSIRNKPALLVIGNLAGDQAAGGEAVLRIAAFIAAAVDREATLRNVMATRCIWLIPRPNPDATEMLFQRPSRAQRRNIAKLDEDRDGEADEDSPSDLDGDGRILRMRFPSPKGKHILDAETKGAILRLADIGRGEKSTHRLLWEGVDEDNDGELGEDPIGGVDLERNFPIHWLPPHKAPGAGEYALCEPESRALADFILAWPSISLVLHTHSGPPEALSSTKDKVPAADAKHYEALQRLYKEATRLKSDPLGPFAVPKGAKPSSGTLQDFLYHGLGLFAWPARIWTRPPSPASKPLPGEDKLSPVERDQRIWQRFFSKEKIGFVPWKKFRHPSLGAVEIGGFTPFSIQTPPPRFLVKAVTPVLRFALRSISLLPEIEILRTEVRPLSGDTYRVSIEVRNRGFLPTHSARAEQIRRVQPTVLRISLEDGDGLLWGKARQLLPRLEGGRSKRCSWIVRVRGRHRVHFSVRSARAGVAELALAVGKDL